MDELPPFSASGCEIQVLHCSHSSVISHTAQVCPTSTHQDPETDIPKAASQVFILVPRPDPGKKPAVEESGKVIAVDTGGELNSTRNTGIVSLKRINVDK